VFDLQQRRVTHFLPLEDSESKIAAGRDKLLIASPKQAELSRWEIGTGRRELAVPVDGGTVQQIVLGPGGPGPVLVMVQDAHRRQDIRWLDLHTLSPVEITPLTPALRWGGGLEILVSWCNVQLQPQAQEGLAQPRGAVPASHGFYLLVDTEGGTTARRRLPGHAVRIPLGPTFQQRRHRLHDSGRPARHERFRGRARFV
jgi:hypothetical protein